MDIQNILTLIQAVSDSALTAFELEEGNTKLSLKRADAGDIGNTKDTENVRQMEQAGADGILSGVLSGIQNIQSVQERIDTGAQVDADKNTAGRKTEIGEIASDKIVVSPLVGTFYASSSPEAESFVKVGDTVKKGQILGIIEAMKLMNEIESDYDGTIEAILVKNEDVVEYGQPLFRIH